MKKQCYLDPSIELSDTERDILLLNEIEIVEFDRNYSDFDIIEYLLLHSRLDDEVLLKMKGCKYIGIRAHNLDYVNTALAAKMGIKVKGLEHQHGVKAVAEHTFALILVLSKNILKSNTNVVNGLWRKSLGFNTELSGKKLGIIGYGEIGKLVGQIGNSFGMEILVTGNPNNLKEGEVSIQELLKQADVVTLHLSSDPLNKNYIDAQKLALMKEHAILINTARGSVLDYDALVMELERGKFFGVGLDVFADEPYTMNQFANFENVILTPHIAFQTKECLNGMNKELIDKLISWAK